MPVNRASSESPAYRNVRCCVPGTLAKRNEALPLGCQFLLSYCEHQRIREKAASVGCWSIVQ